MHFVSIYKWLLYNCLYVLKTWSISNPIPLQLQETFFLLLFFYFFYFISSKRQFLKLIFFSSRGNVPVKPAALHKHVCLSSFWTNKPKKKKKSWRLKHSQKTRQNETGEGKHAESPFIKRKRKQKCYHEHACLNWQLQNIPTHMKSSW